MKNALFLTKNVFIVEHLSFKFMNLGTDINQECHVEAISALLDLRLESGLSLFYRAGKSCYQDHALANLLYFVL